MSISLSWFATNFIAAFFLPPLNILLLALAGVLLLPMRIGRLLLGSSFLLLTVLSMPVVADRLLGMLEPPYQSLTGEEAEAIVILGGGSYKDATEYGRDTVNAFTLERLRYGAHLARRFGKPVLVTGGAPLEGEAEGRLMHDVLADEFGLTPRWVEERSLNTRENARLSAEILRQAGIRRVYLVTHSWHLARAVPEFRAAGLEVVPAGTGYFRGGSIQAMDWLPEARALLRSYYALHEGIGLVWYRIRN